MLLLLRKKLIASLTATAKTSVANSTASALCCECRVTATSTTFAAGSTTTVTQNGKSPKTIHCYCNAYCYYYCAICLASTSCCLLPCRVDHRGTLPSTVRFKATRGEDRVDGRGVLSLHGKQFRRANAQAIRQKEGICHACLTNGRNNRGRMWEGTTGEQPEDSAAGSNASAPERRETRSAQSGMQRRMRTQRQQNVACEQISRHQRATSRRVITARQSR